MPFDPSLHSTASSSDRLRSVGLKVTTARVQVLEVLSATVRPLSHSEIEAQLEVAKAERSDRVTLYRVLNALALSGLALKAADSRGVFRFSAAQTHAVHDEHMHFRCEACGGVFCLEMPPPAAPSLPAGFRLHGVDLDMHGTCARCGAGEVKRKLLP